MPAWVPGHGEDAGFAQRSIAKALEAGLVFRPLSQTAVDTLAWFRQQSPSRQAALKAGLSPERELQVLADWRTKVRR
jgi:2'-hydroxyisoflavone reductase